MDEVILPALGILFALGFVGAMVWAHFLRGQTVGAVAARGQGKAFTRRGPMRIVVKRNVSAGDRVSSVDILFRGSMRIVTVRAGSVQQLARAIDEAAAMVKSEP